jgi:beta-N-acetylhexosaminidase
MKYLILAIASCCLLVAITRCTPKTAPAATPDVSMAETKPSKPAPRVIPEAPKGPDGDLAEIDPNIDMVEIPFLTRPSRLGLGPVTPGLQRLEDNWVDSVFATMSLDERVGQVLMLRANSKAAETDFHTTVEDQVRRLQPGGLCFFQGSPELQAELTNRYQAISRTPMLISMDAEYGLGMRLPESCITYPRQMTMGAIQNDQYIYELGQEMARQCLRLGVQVSFSPVADVNNNPANPVINDRSFGEDRYNVAAKATQYMLGLQHGGVMACAKHFPGHGDTDTDSHHALPVINFDLKRLDSLELYPFKQLIRQGVGSFMVAHLNIPVLDNRSKYPTTLSRNTVNNLLREKLNFNGLIFTDAMEMKAVADSFPAGIADLEALKAGNDMILLPVDPNAAHAAIKAAVTDGSMPLAQFETSVKRVLRFKYRLRLTRPQQVKLEGLRSDLNSPRAFQVKRNLFKQAITLVRDEDNLAGFTTLNSSKGQLRIASLALGDTARTVFQEFCGRYASIRHFGSEQVIGPIQFQRLLDSLSQYDVVLVSHHKTRSKAKDNYGLSPGQIDLVNQLCARTQVAMTVFGNPYSLQYFDNCLSLMLAFTEDPIAQELAAQAWFGALDIGGRLPVTASAKAKYKQGITKKFAQKRLTYDLPETVGMSSDTLAQMDQLIAEMIANGAVPGCQVMVVKNGTVVWNKAYGHYTYEALQPVTTETLYDIASITKVAATTLSLMQLYDQGKIDLNQPMANYVPLLKKSNKSALKVGEMLIHQAGLKDWIAFYEKTIDANKQPLPRIYRKEQVPGFTVPVATNLWMRNDYVDTMWQEIAQSPLRPNKEYKYSDLTMYLSAAAVAELSGQSLDRFAFNQFYRPMGLSRIGFNPWQRGQALQCAPSEQDNYFRQQAVQGYVHDMGAAMIGGVSGHAGLFSNTHDLAVLFQMLLNKGEYAGQRYLSAATVQLFTQRYGGSTRRGLGFDMKETNTALTANMSPLASVNTFGHTGFTGNAIWADPDRQLIFIFLSNRTFPTMNNNKLMTGDYRTRLQSIVYRSVKS